MTKLLVFGYSGQVASEMRRLAPEFEPDAVFLSRAEADLEQPDMLAGLIERHAPEQVVIAAAYTAVDKAESEEGVARLVNADAPKAIAAACARAGVPVIHISTDFVFNGQETRPYREEDPVAPLGVYGATKLEGERAVLGASEQNVVLRTSWVFSRFGRNFAKTMIRLGRERDRLTIVSDQIGQPTPARALAEAIYALCRRLDDGDQIAGLYHYSGRGAVSWADFARAVIEAADIQTEVCDIPTTDYPTPAKRPAWSVLDCTKFEHKFDARMPDWRDYLPEVVQAAKAETTGIKTP